MNLLNTLLIISIVFSLLGCKGEGDEPQDENKIKTVLILGNSIVKRNGRSMRNFAAAAGLTGFLAPPAPRTFLKTTWPTKVMRATNTNALGAVKVAIGITSPVPIAIEGTPSENESVTISAKTAEDQMLS